MKENINNFLMLCVKVIILCKDCLKNIKKKCDIELRNYSKWFSNLDSYWGFKWILTEDFKFRIKPNMILTWSSLKSRDTKINYLWLFLSIRNTYFWEHHWAFAIHYNNLPFCFFASSKNQTSCTSFLLVSYF